MMPDAPGSAAKISIRGGIGDDAAPDRTIDVGAALDAATFGRAHVAIFTLCLLLMLLDGYEIYVLALLLRPISIDFGVTASALTPVVVAQTAGLVAGSYLIAPFADRWGRRPLLIGCTAAFAALTGLAGLTDGVVPLAAIRFLSAMAFSAAMANGFSIAAEIFPLRRRGNLLVLLSCGFVAGPLLAAGATALLLPAFGWRSLFIAGCIIPLALLVPLWLLLPESLRFMVRRDVPPARIASALRRFAPRVPVTPETIFVLRETATTDAASVADLLRGRQAPATLLNWLIFLLSGATIALLGAWLPTIYAESAGLTYAEARNLTAIFGASGFAGTIILGFTIDRFRGSARLLWPMFAIAAAAILALALAGARTPEALLALIMAGAFLLTAQGALYSLTPALYPTRLRATGVGWSVGAGRAGGLIGAALGGALLTASLGMLQIFGLLAILLGCCAIAAFAFSLVSSGSSRQAHPRKE